MCIYVYICIYMYIYIYIYTYIYAGPPRWRGSRMYTNCHVHSIYIEYILNFFHKKRAREMSEVSGVYQLSRELLRRRPPLDLQFVRYADIHRYIPICTDMLTYADGGRHWICNLCGMPTYADIYRYADVC